MEPTTPTTTSNLSPTLTLAEAGRALTVHQETLRRMAVANEIPALRIRSRWAIPRLFIDDWVSGHLDRWALSKEGVWQRHVPI
jgi:excisionase family DNA binding protein